MVHRRLATFVAAMLGAALLLAPASAPAKVLKTKRGVAEPSGIPFKVSAVSRKGGQIFLTLATKERKRAAGRSRFKTVDRARAKGANVSDGRVDLHPLDPYEPNTYSGLLGVGPDWSQYYSFNVRRGKINFW